MKKFFGAIMRHALLQREVQQHPPCPLAVKKAGYALSQRLEFGGYTIEIDPVREVGFFTGKLYTGQFWLAAGVFLGTDHLLPRPVQAGLGQLGYAI